MDDHRLNVLHLIDPGLPGGGGCTLKLLADVATRLTDVRHDLIIIGNAGHLDLARSMGLRPIALLPPPPKVARFASRTFRGVVSELERRRGRYDLIHGWTQRSAEMCGKALPGRKRLTTLALGPDYAWGVKHLLPAEKHSPVSLYAFNTAVRNDLVVQGIAPESVEVMSPGIAASSDDNLKKKAAWRERWKVDDKAFVMGVISQPLAWTDARIALSILIRLSLTERSIRMVLHHKADCRVDAERWARQHGVDHFLIWEDALATPWEVAPGLDAALAYGGVFNAFGPRPPVHRAGRLFAGDGLLPVPGMLPSLYVMSAGVPVVAEDSGAAGEVHGDELRSLLVGQENILRMCDPIGRLYDDRSYYETMSDRSRKVIATRFALDSFVAKLRGIYSSLGSAHRCGMATSVAG